MRSEKIDQIAVALMNFQEKCPAIKKTKKGGGDRKPYKYAPIDEILSAVTPVLKSNGLVVIQGTQQTDGGFVLNTLLMHTSGQWLDSNYPLDTSGTEQDKGSSQTYSRRYGLCGLLGIVSEDDDDGAAATETQQGKSQTTKTPATTAGSLPPCEACGTMLALSAAGKGYYCPDFKKPLDPNSEKPQHTRFTIDKLEEYKHYLFVMNENNRINDGDKDL